jgi:diguanylate cyclase (GGDEF)-like protein
MAFNVWPFWLIGALCAIGFGLLVLVVRRSYPDYLERVLLFLGAANLCLGASYALRCTGPWVGRFAFEDLTSTLVIACLSLEYRAVCDLKRLPPFRALLIGPPLLMFALCFWFSFVRRNITVQLMLVNVMVTAMLFLLSGTLWRTEDGHRRFADGLTSLAYALLGVATCAVIFDYLRVGHFSVEYDFNIRRSFFNNVASIVTEGVVFPLFLLMVSERLNRVLAVQAMRDPLTGLYNRRAFEEIAFREISGASRSGLSLSVLMIDIDHFKQVNDQYGHATGDEVLNAAATALRHSLRDEDFLCRWGGDEFCALLPRARQEQAQNVAERVLRTFEGLDFPLEGKPIKIAVSLGAVTHEGNPQDLARLVKRADAAMYRAKQAGGHCFAASVDGDRQ